MSLKIKAVSGIKWTALSQFGRQGVSFITTAILARLLVPSDYGLLGMATVVTGLMYIFSDLGTSSAVIQKKDISQNLLSSVYWVNVFFGILIMVFIVLASPLIALFYNEPRLIDIMKVLSLTFIITGASTLHQTLLQRGLQFERIAKIECISTLLASVVGIVAATMGFGVWSLVYQALVGSIVGLILLWCSSKWRPSFLVDLNQIKAIYSYSVNLVGFNVLNYFVRNADYMLIGRYLGAQDLGYYTLAYRLMLYPLQNVSGVLGRVMFPVFSKLQDDDVRFREAYTKVNAAIALVTFPMMFGLWVVVDPFVMWAFGEKWQPVVLLLKILAPVGLIQSVATTVGFIYQVKGRTDWMFRWGIGSGLVFLTSFIIGLQWGIVGVASAYFLASLLLLYPSFAIPFSLISLKVSAFVKDILRPFYCSSIMFGTLLVVSYALPSALPNGGVLLVTISFGVAVYGFSSWCINRKQLIAIYELIGPRH